MCVGPPPRACPKTVIAAVLLLHERSVKEIVPELSAAELEQVIMLVGRSPRVYPPGTLDALKSKRNASPTPMAESRAKKQTPSTAGADHPLREQTRACRGFGTAAQQSTIEHASGAAASQNTAAVTDQPAAPIKPDAEQMRMAHERRLAMLRAHTPQSDTEPERAITAKKPGTRPGTRTETVRRRYEVAQLMKLGLSVRTISMGTGIPPTSVHRAMRAVARAEAKQEVAVLEIIDKLLEKTVRRRAKAR